VTEVARRPSTPRRDTPRATVAVIQAELASLGNPDRARGALRFFKTGPGEYGEGDRFRGLTVPFIRAAVRRHSEASQRVVLGLLRSPFHEDRVLALLILVRQFARGDEAARRRIYELYLANTKRINNWDLVDCSAEHIVGGFLADRSLRPLYVLARSASLWERRIAIMATFHFIKQGRFDPTLEIAERLLGDREDLVHKAAGWMLREVGKRDLAAEERFLQAHAGRMPRTMLRYAIERFPEGKRQTYLGAGARARGHGPGR
jgi:3-methyladenine DNA glycosylase AlkD